MTKQALQATLANFRQFHLRPLEYRLLRMFLKPGKKCQTEVGTQNACSQARALPQVKKELPIVPDVIGCRVVARQS